MNPPLDDTSYQSPPVQVGDFAIKGRRNDLPEGINVAPSWSGEPPLLGLSMRLPPSNVPAEQALLGGILANNKAFDLVEEFLRPEHFVNPVNGRIFGAIKRRIESGQLADAVTLKHEFDQDGELAEIGGAAYLGELLKANVASIVVGEYGRAVKDAWVRRALISRGEELVERAFNPDEIPEEAAAFTASEIDNIASDGAHKKSINMADAIATAMAMSQKAHERGGYLGNRCGVYRKLDRHLRGFRPGGYYLVAARPGMGKSVVGLQIGSGIAETEGLPVLFASLEMPADQLGMRHLAMETGIRLDDLMSGEWMSHKNADDITRRLGDATVKLSKIPLEFADKDVRTVEGIRTQARLLKRKHRRLGAIIVDYVQQLRLGRGVRASNSNERVTILSASLAQLSIDLECPVIALSQLNRGPEGREDKRPTLADLRDSGSLEQDAAVVMFPFRQAYYLEKKEPRFDGTCSDSEFQVEYATWQADLARIANDAEFIIEKNRHGSNRTIRMGWDGPCTKYYDITEDQAHG